MTLDPRPMTLDTRPLPKLQRIAHLSNIFAQIVNLACNLIRILDCDYIVELLQPRPRPLLGW